MHLACRAEKIAGYADLLRVTQNEGVRWLSYWGPEITNAVAPGQERMSQPLIAQKAGIAGNIFTPGYGTANNVLKSIYAPDAQVSVLLPNSRKQECEADHYGLILAAMAGYNPPGTDTFLDKNG